MSTQNILINVGLNAGEYYNKVQQLNASIKQLIEDQKALQAAGKQSDDAFKNNAQALRDLQRQQSVYTGLAAKQSGSVNELHGSLAVLTQQYNELSRAEREGSDTAKDLQLQIAAVNKEMLASDGANGSFKRNVMDFPSNIADTLKTHASDAASSAANAVGLDFLPEGLTALYNDARATIDLFTKSVADQRAATELAAISNNLQAESAQKQAIASTAAADAAAANVAADQAAAQATALRAQADAQLQALQTTQLSQNEAATAAAAQLATANAALVAEQDAMIATNEALIASQLELTAAEEARVAQEAALAASTAAQSAASASSVSSAASAASGLGLAAGVAVAALALVGATVFSFFSKLKGFSDGVDQVKAKVGGAFSELGRMIGESFSKNDLSTNIKNVLGYMNVFSLTTKLLNGELRKTADQVAEAGRVAENFEKSFQSLKDRNDIDDFNKEVVQSEAERYRLQARNRNLSIDEQQRLLKKADQIERDQAEKTKQLQTDMLNTTVDFANKSLNYRGVLSEKEKEQLRNGDIALANSLLNQGKITQDAYAKLKEIYKQRIKDMQANNQELAAEQAKQDQEEERKAQLAKQAAERRKQIQEKANADLKTIREQDLQAHLYNATMLFTARQKEMYDLEHSYDAQITLHKKYGKSTVELRKELNARMTELSKKYEKENLSEVQASMDRATDMYISMIENTAEREEARRKEDQKRELRSLDANIKDKNDRIAKGEKNLTELLVKLNEERKALLLKQKTENDKATKAKEKAKVATPSTNQADPKNPVVPAKNPDGTIATPDDGATPPATEPGVVTGASGDSTATKDDAQKKGIEQAKQLTDDHIALNEKLESSAKKTLGNIAKYVGENTIAGKAALVAQKVFVAAEITMNAARERSAIRVAAANEIAWLSKIPVAGPFLAAARRALMGLELAQVTLAQIKAVADIGTAVSNLVTPGKAKGGLHYDSDGNGTVLSGPGSGTSDSMNARLSNGEAVINARSTQMYRPLLSAINQAGGGVAFAQGGVLGNNYAGTFVQNLAGQAGQSAAISSAVTQAMRNVKIYTLVTDITYAQQQQSRITDLATF